MLLFNNIIVVIGTVVILVSFILSFKLRNKRGVADYFKFFYWIPVIGLLYSANTILRRSHVLDLHVVNAIQNFLSLIDFLIRSYFFYIVFRKAYLNNYLKVIFFAAVIAIIYLLFTKDFNQPFFELYIIFSLVIFIFSLLYYYKLFVTKPLLILKNDPTFWIITGLFFYAAINFPVLTILKYWVKDLRLVYFLISVVNIIVIVEHLLFIKGYRCAQQEKIKQQTY